MTTVYLHIGTHKTGTTSLQKFLFDNREKLLEKGYLYPLSGTSLTSESDLKADIEARYNHNDLARSVNKDNLVSRVGSWADLKKEINTIKPKNVLISSEIFSFNSKSYNTDTIALIKKMLEDYETIKIVIYLRRQDEYIRSLYCQHVKRSHRYIGDIQEFILHYKNKMNYHSMLESSKKTLGSENIIVRIFEKEQMKNCCLVDDFLTAINLESDNEYQFKLRNSIGQNISPNGRATKLIRLIDKIIPIKLFWQIEKKCLGGINQHFSEFSENTDF